MFPKRFSSLAEIFRRLADAGEVETAAGQALVEERYRALQRQVPVLYTVVLTNFLGIHIATGGRLNESLFSPIGAVVIIVIVRMIQWVRSRGYDLPARRMLTEVRKMFVFMLICSISFSAWALHLLHQGYGDYDHIIMLASLAAVGVAYGSSSYPAAARLPLLFVALPVAFTLLRSPQLPLVGLGLSLCVVAFLMLRQLEIHNKGFSELVASRAAIDAERERARKAERLARAEQAKARLMADTDPLTGLANRRAFLASLTRRAARLQRHGCAFSLAMVDLDAFKPINDTFGHATGDTVLKEVGHRLMTAAGRGALIARMGGDEFALLLPTSGDAESAGCVGRAVVQALQEPFDVDGREFRVSGCCGLTLLRPGDSNVAEALIRADMALYRAKLAGRSQVAIFSAEMDEMNQRRIQIEQALRMPENQRSLELAFQPIKDLVTGEIRSFEALARWEHQTLGRVSPAEFIPVAEQINVIKELTDILLAKAVAEANLWSEAVRLSFNLSAVELCTERSSGRILALLERCRFDPHRLQVEVTETALLADYAVARDNLQELREAGVRILLDDFGAGHASISYLREMKFDGIKLDGSFMTSVTFSQRSRRLLKGVIELCASLGLPCIAEHIETEEQLRLLRDLGCREGQGFLLAPPISPAEAARLAKPKIIDLTGRRAA